MYRFLVFCTFVLWTSLLAEEISLVRSSETWRYFKGVAEPSAQAGRWKDPDFDDQSWLRGMNGFTSFGVPGGEPTTLFDFGSGYTTVYFRKQFQILSATNLAYLTLRIDYDDGFIAYLNGQEVARSGIPAQWPDLVPYLATTGVRRFRGALEEIDLSHARHLLRSGTNLLAIQTLNSGPEDFSMCLSAELLGNFTRGPFVQNANTNSIQVVWKTGMPASSSVEFGTNSNALQKINSPLFTTNHVITLQGLSPGTRYFYRVTSSNEVGVARSPIFHFHTLKSTGSITFNVVGDTGTGGAAQLLMANALRYVNSDLVMHLGDVVYPSWVPYLTDARVFSFYHLQMRSTPFYYAHGNHDNYYSSAILAEAMYLPTNNANGSERFYSFDHGDAHFVVLDCDLQAKADYRPGSVQYQWLEQDLKNTPKKWKFLFFHHTIRTSAVHAYDDYDGNGVLDSLQLEESIGTLAAHYGVQIIFNSHDHVYERLGPERGTAVFVSGGGGAYLYHFALRHRSSAQFLRQHHFLRVEVSGDTAQVQALDWNLRVLDQVQYRISLPPDQIYQAQWHSPVLEMGTADDGDGNIQGQTFDFAGTPVPSRMGAFSNPGRLYLNNDRDFLYLGLDQVMLQAEQTLHLFLETAEGAGVEHMRDIGNGILDPDGEGADALDFLTNLAFTNFRPNVALLLGDEFADGTYRSFSRSGQQPNTGQGAFHLKPGLPLVEEARIQQFNHSPQLTPVPGEQNADYIKVALPLSSIRAKPGELIRIALLVGRGPFAPIQQIRELDTGAIAAAMHQSRGFTTVAGIQVQLAPDPDPDQDQLTTVEELQIGTDPFNPDSDADGMPDGWEWTHRFNPLDPGDARQDADEDGLSNLAEYQNQTDPWNRDTDDDSLPDLWEVEMGLDPRMSLGIHGPSGDPDGDIASNYHEFLAGTHPRDAASVLRLTISSAGESRARISWLTVRGRKYQLQQATSVLKLFEDILDPTFPRMGTGELESFLQDLTDEEGTARIYRLKIVP